MKAPVRNFIIRDGAGTREAETLVLGRGLRITETAGGLPELEGVHGSEVLLTPSGADDTQAINDALATGKDVRLGPGTFTISDTLVVGAAGSQRLGGSGADRTDVSLTGPGFPAVLVVAGHCTVEGMRIVGTGSLTGRAGVRAAFPSVAGNHVVLRSLQIDRTETAVHLENATCDLSNLAINHTQTAVHLENVTCDISNLRSVLSNQYGIFARGLKGTIRNVEIFSADTHGIHIEDGDAVTCHSVLVTDSSDAGIHVSGGTGYLLSAVHTEGCGMGLTITGADVVTVDSLFVAAGFLGSGVWVDQVRSMALNGCWIRGARLSLLVENSQNVVAGALLSDHAGAAGPWSHLTVRNSAGVFVTGMRVISQSPPPTYEVDVSLAGARVLFGPHNINPAHINSGGNFAAL